jgi:FkbM family methyltransferase
MQYLRQEYHINLFASACALLRPDIICEIGSYDAREARTLAVACPDSTVIAFEANPENFFKYCLSRDVLASRLSVQHLAISDSDGLGEILIPPPPEDATDHVKTLMQGMGSMLRRPDYPDSRSLSVPKRRLDNFFGPRAESNKFALWVDVEGHTASVLDGAAKVLANTVLVKLELETFPYWEGQALAPDMTSFMENAGFELLVTSDPSVLQFDALFLRRGLDRPAVQGIINQIMAEVPDS